MDFDPDDKGVLTEVSPLLQQGGTKESKKESIPTSDPSLSISPSSTSILMGDVNSSSSDSVSSDAPPDLERSITKAIQLERRRKRTVGTGGASPAAPQQSGKGKEEEKQDDSVDKLLDAAFESMQQDLKAKFDKLRETLKSKK